MSTVNLIARISTTSDQFDPVHRLLADYARIVRGEPGNLRFELYAVDHDLLVLERYEDDAAFQQHLQSSDNARFNQALQELLDGGGSTLEMLVQLDP
jgi:quinol monooxygenase YgiN